MFSQEVAKENFIPESLFYLLGMKASNETASKFQMWLATDVMPSIWKPMAFIAESENVDEGFIKKWIKVQPKAYH